MAVLFGGPLFAADTCSNATTDNGSKCVMVHGDTTPAGTAADPFQSCMADQGRPAAVCTANDLTFVVTDLGVQDDGCYGPNDTAKLRLRSQIANTTAQTRYDVGLWFSVDGDGDPDGTGPLTAGDGATHGRCDRAVLFDARLNSRPANASNPTSTEGLRGISYCTTTDPDALDIYGLPGNGPYDNADDGNADSEDFCRDIRTNSIAGCDSGDADSLRDNSVYDLPFSIEIPCSDTSNAFLTIPACMSWGNNPDQIGGANNACDDATELSHGTSSKCTCQTITTKVSVPDLALECKVWNGATSTWEDSTTVRSGPFGGGAPVSMQVRVQLTYTNSASCDWSTSSSVRSRCGTSSMTRFDAADDVAASGSTDGGSFALDDDGQGRDVLVNTNESLRWYPNTDATFTDAQESVIPPQTDTTPGTTLNGYTDTLYYWYTVPTGLANGSSVTLDHTTVWFDKRCSNDGVQMCSTDADCVSPGTCQNLESTTAVNQPLTDACTLNISATYAAVGEVAARRSGGTTVVEWQTRGEVGTVGFDVYRRAGKEWQKVNESLVPALLVEQGGSYRLVDSGAPAAGKVTYRIVERDSQGGQQQQGPFELTIAAEGPGDHPLPRAETVEAAAHEPSPRMQARLAEMVEAAPEAGRGGEGRAVARASAVDAKAATAAPAAAQKLGVGESGPYALSAAEIASALGRSSDHVNGLIKSGRLALSQGGRAVAWTPAGNGIAFFGEALASNYATRNVYWLQEGSATTMGLRRTSSSGPGSESASFVDSVHLEQDKQSRHDATADPDSDYWYWGVVWPSVPSLARGAYPFDLVAPTAQGTARLVGNFYGYYLGDGNLSFAAEALLNGAPIGSFAWQGAGVQSLSLDVPAALLRAGANTLELVAGQGLILVDSFDLTYSRLYRTSGDRALVRGDANAVVTVSGFSSGAIGLYDLTDPRAPVRIDAPTVDRAADGSWRASFRPETPARPYLLVADPGLRRTDTLGAAAGDDLRASSNRGEYLVVTPRALRAGADELAAYRQADGLEVRVVELETVTDVFGHGVYSPDALRAFLAHAWSNWAAKPRYVVLLGKGSYDYRNVLGVGGNLMPPIMGAGYPGLVPADGRYGDVDDDGRPEMAVGRIPALTVDEVRDYLRKVEAREEAGGLTSAVVVADNDDHGGNFASDADALAGLVAGSAGTIKLGAPLDAAQARQQVGAALGGGSDLLAYVGHGGLDRFANEGLLTIADVPALGATDRTAVVASLTCNIGYFAIPGFSCLGEELVMAPGAGAAAVVAPTSLSFNGDAVRLGTELLPRLGAGSGRLGDAWLASVRALPGSVDPRLLRVYVLFGDPALRLGGN